MCTLERLSHKDNTHTYDKIPVMYRYCICQEKSLTKCKLCSFAHLSGCVGWQKAAQDTAAFPLKSRTVHNNVCP